MTTRSKGPLAGFGWLKRGTSLVYRRPKLILGGAAFLLLACLLPMLIILPTQFHSRITGTPFSPNLFVWTMVGSMLVGLLLVPLYAGYLRVIDAAEHGLPARARDIFKPYRQGEALRLIGLGLAAKVIYYALLGMIVVTAGKGIINWYMQVLAAQANHQLPPALPHGFGITVALFFVLGLFMMGFYAISLGQVALSRRGVFNAIRDGVIGALKNTLPLLVFALGIFLAYIAVVIVLVIVVVLLALLCKFVGLWLVFALMIPLYIAMMLLTFAIMFGVAYYLWRDVCGDDTETDVAQAIAA